MPQVRQIPTETLVMACNPKFKNIEGPVEGATWKNVCARVAIEGVAVVSGCYAFDYIWHNQYCNLIFQCGCTWPWAGGSSNCNIHNPNGPHCPWCESPKTHTQFLVDDRVMVMLMVLAYTYQRYRVQRRKRNACEKKLSSLVRHDGENYTSIALDSEEGLVDAHTSIVHVNSQLPDIKTSLYVCSRREIISYALAPILTFIIWGFLSGLIFFLFVAPTYPWFFFQWREK